MNVWFSEMGKVRNSPFKIESVCNNKYGTAHCVLLVVTGSIFLNYDVFLSPTVVLILANSVEPDKMQHPITKGNH